MTTTALLALGVTGLLAAAAGLFTWVVADLAWDVQRALRDAGRRWRGLDLVAWLRAMEVGSAAPDELAEAELYGLVGVPWRGLMALSAAGGVLLLLPLALELNSWPLAGLGLLAGLAPEVVRRLRIREAQAAILNQVRDLLLALRLRLVLQVSLTAALREIASTPAEVERLGILGQRLQHHVTSAA
ncbi:MAG: hypothetical protein KKB13_28025, partial [Chloroflexi bacterium]|nr:hypothetical protein [Chloroflexota bacterium]